MIEFAFIAPILITMLLGICDIAPATMARFKTGNATQSVADLTSQFAQAQASDLASLFASGSDLMAPYSGSTLVLRITNIASDGKGNAFVYWSCGQGVLPALTAKSTVTSTPTGTPIDNLINRYNTKTNGFITNGTNSSYVMVESQYTYSAPAQFVVVGPQVMKTVAYTVPRFASYVGPWDGNVNDQPTLPASTTQTTAVSIGNGIVCNVSY